MAAAQRGGMIDVHSKVSDLVLDHPACARVFKRHRIDYCCQGQLPLSEACAKRGVDSAALISELNAAIATAHAKGPADPRALSTSALIDQIVRRHHRYLRDALPFLVPLAKKVATVHSAHQANLLDVRDLVAELSDQLLPHLDEEEQSLFPALKSAAPDRAGLADKWKALREEHLQTAALLEQLRNAAHDYVLPEDACTSFTTLYRELETLEADVFEHVHLENHVLMPRFEA
jgi:regulator of cell morphogenesis and NO signaling